MGSLSWSIRISVARRTTMLAPRYLTLCFLLAGCAATPPAPIIERSPPDRPQQPPASRAPSIEPAIAKVLPPTSIPSPSSVSTPTPPRVTFKSTPAVRQLLTKAHLQTEAGQYEAAATTVERAIRISPDDPWAWHHLAQVHLLMGDLAQAKATAQRSKALPKASPDVLTANWRLIAEVEHRIGNPQGAARASANARRLANEAP